MGGLARLSCSVRMLFSKMSIAQATTADFHCAAAATDTSLLRSRSPTRDGDIGPTDPTMPLNGFELSDELKTAPPEVKKVFSLQLASLRQIHEAKKHRFVKLCQRHPYDFDSLEYKGECVLLRKHHL
ncbi:hypothetical protein MTO96_000655 [Rhipicephalus appendiculatus]